MEEGDVSFLMRFLWNHGQIPFQTGFIDNFVSNEIIVPGITAEEVFASLPDNAYGRPIMTMWTMFISTIIMA